MNAFMRAAAYERYGSPDVVQIRDLPMPDPGAGELLVRVHAAALNPKDLMVRAGKFRVLSGLRGLKGIGYDWAGELVRAGKGAQAPAKQLFGMINGWSARACSEYVVVRANECAAKPTRLSWEEAASVPLAALTALQALRDDGQLKRGQRVLINGASGGVGVHAVQIAKILGAHVTTFTSANNREHVAALGADQTLDYKVDKAEAHAPFDLFFDVFGNRSLNAVRPLLREHGRYVTTVPKLRNVVDIALSAMAKQRGRLVVVKSRAEDLELLASWLEQGQLRPVVDRVFQLDELPEAQRYLATKRARGKLVVRV